MSLIVGNGMCITYMETDVTCPICTFEFNCGEKYEKAKKFIFKMKCPACKSWIGIRMPVFGGTTKCFEWNPPKTKEDNQLKTETPNRYNGKIVVEKPAYDDNSDDAQADIYVQ
jgi:hypothetical protein